jgi:uncharacterized protein
MPASDILSPLGLDQLIADRRFKRDARAGRLTSPFGARSVLAGAEIIRSLDLVINRERPGAFAAILKSAGHIEGKKYAADLDLQLSALGKPPLAGLPLEACLVLIENYFAVHGFGELKLDLTHAPDHGLVVATLEHAFFAEVHEGKNVFADHAAAGLLQGFFDYITGEGLGCEEIACVRHGAPRCTFVLTAPERLTAMASFIGHEDAAAIISRLCT